MNSGRAATYEGDSCPEAEKYEHFPESLEAWPSMFYAAPNGDQAPAAQPHSSQDPVQERDANHPVPDHLTAVPFELEMLLETLDDEEDIAGMMISKSGVIRTDEEMEADEEEVEGLLELDGVVEAALLEAVTHLEGLLSGMQPRVTRLLRTLPTHINATVNKLELALAIVTFAVAMGALVTGIFGMNLRSRIEEHATAFYFATFGIVAGISLITAALLAYTKEEAVVEAGAEGVEGVDVNDRKDGTAINEMIRVPEVRLVGVDKEMIGITDTRDAMDQAAELGMDLVMINKDADPPVCRLMDYKKFTYDQGKKDKEAKKKQRNLRVDVKELKLRYNIDTHDYEVRKKAARKFLSAGDKVKFLCQFRGREMEFKDIAFKMFEKLRTELADVGTMEGNRPNLEGRTMVMFMGPTKTKAATIQAQEQEEKAAKRAAQKAAKKAQIAAERAAAGLDAEEDDDDDDLDNSVDEGVDESVDEGVDTSVDEGVDASIDMDGDEKPEDNASVVNVEETVAPVRPNAFPSLSRPKPPGAA
eukprot:gene2865-3664_t